MCVQSRAVGYDAMCRLRTMPGITGPGPGQGEHETQVSWKPKTGLLAWVDSGQVAPKSPDRESRAVRKRQVLFGKEV